MFLFLLLFPFLTLDNPIKKDFLFYGQQGVKKQSNRAEQRLHATIKEKRDQRGFKLN